MLRNATTWASAVALATLATSSVASTAAAQRLDRPISEVWTVQGQWDQGAEAEYSAFVATIGRAVAQGRCRSLNICLNDPTINPLHEAGARPLEFRADCADVPYVLRAYFAYRHGLPFAFAARMRGHGRDARYLTEAHPEGIHLWTEYSTPRALLENIGSIVHSGYFRTAPDVEPADFYQVAISPGSIRPGTTYYDPNGHVLVVYEVRPDGEILLFDGHPGGSLTHKRFGDKLVLGTARLGGGFKNFRPFVYRNGTVIPTRNAQLRDFAGDVPFNRANFRVGGTQVGYHAWVRSRMSTRATLTASRSEH
jgi:hypothetical protein